MAASQASRVSYCSSGSLRASSKLSAHKITPQWQAARFPARRTFPARSFGSSSQLQERKYTKEHEWIELEPNSTTGTIGISTYAAKSLGDVVYVELPAHSLQVKRGDVLGAVESVKSASDILTPVSGTVVAVNESLQESPGSINKDAEGEGGWIAKLEIDKAGRDEFELKSQVGIEEGTDGPEALMTKEEYAKFTAE